MRLFVTIFLLMSALPPAIAQEVVVTRSDSLARIDGEDFLIHRVASKQTLFSIAKTYGVKLSRLVFSNPGILEGIQPGQFVKVPKAFLDEVTETPKRTIPSSTDGGYILYEVPPRMTLYSISREHGTTVTALQEANPELQDGLRVGMTIRIPVQRLLSDADTMRVELPASRRDTAVSMPLAVRGPILASKRDSGVFEVAVLLPFFLQENDSLLRYEGSLPPKVHSRSAMALHFYEGLLIAADSIRATRLDVRLRVFDTGNSETKVEKLLANGAAKGCDLIIGPFYSGEFKKVADKAAALQIPVVTPTVQGRQVIEDNPWVFKIMPTEERMMEMLGQHLSRLKATNNLILHFGKSEQQLLLWRLRTGLEHDTLRAVPSFPAYDVSNGLRDSIFHRLSPVQPNHIIVLSNDEAKVAKMVRTLAGWAKETDITVYAPSSWPRFRNVEVEHWDRLKLHVPDPFCIDYDDEVTEQFIYAFRERFSTEPSTFAYRGYDIGIHFLRALPGLRAEGLSYIQRLHDHGLQSDFKWARITDGGFENISPRILDHTGLKLNCISP